MSEQVIVTSAPFNAQGDGITDDTAAIQAAVDAAWQGNTVFLPSGEYIVRSVTVPAGVSITGQGRHLTTVKRPPARETDTVRYLKWLKTFYVNYEGLGRSARTCFRDMTIDGNALEQGPYEKYQLEQAHLIGVYTDKDEWRGESDVARVSVERCSFRNGVADGISLSGTIEATIRDCDATDLFRGGLTARGRGLRIDVDNFVGRGTKHPTGFNFETVYDSDVRVDNIHLAGSFDVMAKYSRVVGSRVVAKRYSPMNFTGSKVRLRECEFVDAAIRFPQDVEFADTLLDGNTRVWWTLQNRPIAQNARMCFRRCRFSGTGTGLWLSRECPANDNWLVTNDCVFDESLATGIEMERGGNLYVRGGRIDSRVPLRLDGFKTTKINRAFNAIVDSVAYTGDIDVVRDRPENKLEIRNKT